GVLGGLSSASSAIKLQSQVRKDPVGSLDSIEKLREADAFSAPANQLLKEAATAAKMPDLALFALETIVAGNPKDTRTMHELAKLYMENEQQSNAGNLYSTIIEMNPNDRSAPKGSKDAAAAASMQKGGWDREEATYRDLI